MAKIIALIAGGFTGEYEVSLNSAKNIAASLDAAKYTVYTILINRDRWFYEGDNGQVDVDKNDFSLTIDGKKITFDAAFITIHGTPGEDGKLQGYFDMLGLPYNTCISQTIDLSCCSVSHRCKSEITPPASGLLTQLSLSGSSYR